MFNFTEVRAHQLYIKRPTFKRNKVLKICIKVYSKCVEYSWRSIASAIENASELGHKERAESNDSALTLPNPFSMPLPWAR